MKHERWEMEQNPDGMILWSCRESETNEHRKRIRPVCKSIGLPFQTFSRGLEHCSPDCRPADYCKTMLCSPTTPPPPSPFVITPAGTLCQGQCSLPLLRPSQSKLVRGWWRRTGASRRTLADRVSLGLSQRLDERGHTIGP